ncbi:response regulator [Ideonella sp. A 288]|uniref:response regulator n=1 Tax=Ideonella sp. A 288 TaxID=1962181 RepID=UPI000B4C1E39|nr:response regulator [Ideonella sp. A 288]
MASTSELPIGGGAAAAPVATPLHRVLVVEADGPLIGLLQTQLEAEGCLVTAESAAEPGAPADLIVVDLPYPRQGGVDSIRRIATRHPMTPILALSSTFFAGIECWGPVARELGVDCVLPKPASCQALGQAVRRLLARGGCPCGPA